MIESKFLLLLCLTIAFAIPHNSDVGYRIGTVQEEKKLRSEGKSALYEIISDELDDGRPIKLL